ncbi:HAD-IB family hydrolase [Panacibacter ginsenosidivorans]|uniref:HAD-IB family hydrolase n=1 Tax=Panacibacter ginsenosidivorans TaxID=1813871 RepID=A0A5B8V4R8_9BACT|nr:HAD-IB family hydrolase [Panacibacter ginsenosidivorans]QEC66025.1 HAD-IB family hydrolase [Panacibacter ginsenosidivorans]
MSTLALFDFDGTITNKDSLLHFTGYAKGKSSLYAGLALLSPVMILNKIGIIPSQFTKNSFLRFFFKNEDLEKFNQLCKNYATTELKTIVRVKALKKINWHKQQAHRIIVVSASPENYIQPWCEALGIECIATKLLVTNLTVKGVIDGLNCNAEEKRRRIEAVINIADYEEIYGYGDTKGDKAMLSVCTKSYYQYF